MMKLPPAVVSWPDNRQCLAQELMKNRAGFTASQQPRLSELQQFAKQQRLQRQRGPSARDQRRDTTTFEAARKTWGAATVSARGSIMTGEESATMPVPTPGQGLLTQSSLPAVGVRLAS